MSNDQSSSHDELSIHDEPSEALGSSERNVIEQAAEASEQQSSAAPVSSLSLDQEQAARLRPIIEAFIFASNKPVSLDKLQELITPEFVVSKSQIRSMIQDLQNSYADSSIELADFNGSYRFQTRSKYGEWVQRLWEEKPQKYSRALLETLALIAYRQPITRGDIEEVRGVAVSSNIMKTLIERGWVRVIGHREVPGRPSIYATTKDFLSHFNLQSLEDLPTLAEIRDLDLIAKEVNSQLELGDLESPEEEASPQASEVEDHSEQPETNLSSGDLLGDSPLVTDTLQ